MDSYEIVYRKGGRAMDIMAVIAQHVIQGECPPPEPDGYNGCCWAGDCTECWWFTLTRYGGDADGDA